MAYWTLLSHLTLGKSPDQDERGPYSEKSCPVVQTFGGNFFTSTKSDRFC